MGDQSKIEWTDATWNPVTGCSKVSPGCSHCYAEELSLRRGWSQLPWEPRYAAQNVILHPERLEQPLKWRKPRRVFVNSMSDMFHELIPDKFVVAVFNVMADAPQHTFQILTKRPERMRDLLRGWHDYGDGRWDEPLPNVWLGVSIENRRFVGRVDVLRATPAAVRFISAEPLLGPLLPPWEDAAGQREEMPGLDLRGIDQLIVGGESGRNHRRMDPEWVLNLKDEAHDKGCAFFFKQWGGRTPKANGRLLEGRTWDEEPRTVQQPRQESLL